MLFHSDGKRPSVSRSVMFKGIVREEVKEQEKKVIKASALFQDKRR